MAEQPYLFGPLWIPIKDGNPTAMSIFKRHYTARERRKVEQFIGPGEKEALITPDARALFAWRKFISDAGMHGVNCAVFRTEGCILARSSDLIISACEIAWRRWPGERLYTYVDPATPHRETSRPGDVPMATREMLPRGRMEAARPQERQTPDHKERAAYLREVVARSVS